jgi:hypothetical protein
MKAIQRKISSVSVLAALLLMSHSCSSQTNNDNIEGAWKGTSICQVKNSPCHDESVVYYITKSSKPNTYTVQMNKIVNNAEEEMGSLDLSYDTSKQTLTGTTKDRQQREAIWKFIINDNQITGTLMIEGNILYRKIQVSKK